jgi:hypothetical protein
MAKTALFRETVKKSVAPKPFLFHPFYLPALVMIINLSMPRARLYLSSSSQHQQHATAAAPPI